MGYIALDGVEVLDVVFILFYVYQYISSCIIVHCDLRLWVTILTFNDRRTIVGNRLYFYVR